VSHVHIQAKQQREGRGRCRATISSHFFLFCLPSHRASHHHCRPCETRPPWYVVPCTPCAISVLSPKEEFNRKDVSSTLTLFGCVRSILSRRASPSPFPLFSSLFSLATILITSPLETPTATSSPYGKAIPLPVTEAVVLPHTTTPSTLSVHAKAMAGTGTKTTLTGVVSAMVVAKVPEDPTRKARPHLICLLTQGSNPGEGAMIIVKTWAKVTNLFIGCVATFSEVTVRHVEPKYINGDNDTWLPRAYFGTSHRSLEIVCKANDVSVHEAVRDPSMHFPFVPLNVIALMPKEARVSIQGIVVELSDYLVLESNQCTVSVDLGPALEVLQPSCVRGAKFTLLNGLITPVCNSNIACLVTSQTDVRSQTFTVPPSATSPERLAPAEKRTKAKEEGN